MKETEEWKLKSAVNVFNMTFVCPGPKLSCTRGELSHLVSNHNQVDIELNKRRYPSEQFFKFNLAETLYTSHQTVAWYFLVFDVLHFCLAMCEEHVREAGK